MRRTELPYGRACTRFPVMSLSAGSGARMATAMLLFCCVVVPLPAAGQMREADLSSQRKNRPPSKRPRRPEEKSRPAAAGKFHAGRAKRRRHCGYPRCALLRRFRSRLPARAPCLTRPLARPVERRRGWRLRRRRPGGPRRSRETPRFRDGDGCQHRRLDGAVRVFWARNTMPIARRLHDHHLARTFSSWAARAKAFSIPGRSRI